MRLEPFVPPLGRRQGKGGDSLLGDPPERTFWVLRHDRLVAAAGLVEQPLAFPRAGKAEDAPLGREVAGPLGVDGHVEVGSRGEPLSRPLAIGHEQTVAISQGRVGEHEFRPPGRRGAAVAGGHVAQPPRFPFGKRA